MSERERGAVAVEFALLVPLLVALLVAITDYGLWYSDSISLRSSAREGVRAAVVDNYPAGCSGTPAEKAGCAAKNQATFMAGSPAAKVYVREGDWDQGNQLIVCTTVKEDGVSGLTPLPSSGILRTRVAMRIEEGRPGDSTFEDADPSSANWSWC